MKPEDETIDTLARAILRDAHDEADQIQTEGKAKADEIRAKAQAEAEQVRKEILDHARQEAERLRSQVIASAQLKARTLQLEHREKLLERVFKAARDRLPGLQKRSDYPQIAAFLLSEAVKQLSASDAELRADAVTQKSLNSSLESLSKDLAVKLAVKDALEEGVGVIVDAADGHLHYDNTLETRLDRMKTSLRSPVYQVLMGEKL
jgi:V/A-type H+-transporting ATPase subunit E